MTRPWTDLGVRCGAALLAMLVLAPVFGALFPGRPFHSVMTRVFLVALVIALIVRRGPFATWPEKIRGMGLRGPHRLRRFAAGAAVSVALLALVLFCSWAVGGRGDPTHAPRYTLVGQLAKAVLAGVAVALLEEVLCRGYLKDVLGGPASALIYAAAHYFRPIVSSAPAGEGYDPLLAVKRLSDLFGGWGDLQNVTLGLFSLFVFGLALNRMRERTGTLYLGIGVHAGLVFALALYRRWLSGAATGDRWIYGGARIHDGVLGTAMLALLLLAAYALPLPRRLRAGGG